MFGFHKHETNPLPSTEEVMKSAGGAKATINAELAKPAVEQVVSVEEAREHVAEEAEPLAQEQAEFAEDVKEQSETPAA